MDSNLTQRQQHILLAIVLDYIATAEPVGSRTISKKYSMGLSPATIRNDMAELEDQGLLTQLHSSSGRIPSDLGYRNFVDFLMEKPILTNDEKEAIRAIYINPRLDLILDQSARILSALSNTVAIIEYPESSQEFVKHFQLLPIHNSAFVIVIVTNTGKVNDYLVNLDEPVDESFFITITNYLNEQLIGTPVINLQIKISELIFHNARYDKILKGIYSTLKNNLIPDKNKISVIGTSKLLKEPEFLENEKAFSLIDFFENMDMVYELGDMLHENHPSKQNELKILIGKEIKIAQLQNCSLIIGSYNIGNKSTGSIGLLGPTRMHYGKSIATLEEMIKNLSYLLSKLYGLKYDNTG